MVPRNSERVGFYAAYPWGVKTNAPGKSRFSVIKASYGEGAPMKPQAGIRNKILAIVVLSAVALIGASLVGLDYIHRQMMDDRAKTLQEVVTLALAEAEHAKQDMDAGKLTRDQALDSLRQQLHLLRFGAEHKDYIFSNFMDGVSFANAGNPAIEGSNLIGKAGPDGRFVFKELIDGVKQHNGGILIYLWQNPASRKCRARWPITPAFPPSSW